MTVKIRLRDRLRYWFDSTMDRGTSALIGWLGVASLALIAVITGLAVLGYFVLVYLIFYLVYMPIDMDHVRGVQGRYFVIALPMAALFIAALVNCELPRGVPAAIAIAGSMIAGITTVEAVLRPHW